MRGNIRATVCVDILEPTHLVTNTNFFLDSRTQSEEYRDIPRRQKGNYFVQKFGLIIDKSHIIIDLS